MRCSYPPEPTGANGTKRRVDHVRSMGRRHPCLLLVGAPESAMQLLYNERHARRMVGASAMALDSHHTTKLGVPRWCDGALSGGTEADLLTAQKGLSRQESARCEFRWKSPAFLEKQFDVIAAPRNGTEQITESISLGARNLRVRRTVRSELPRNY